MTAGAEIMEARRSAHIAELQRPLAGLDVEEAEAIEAALPALGRLLAVAQHNTDRGC